jgi:predicted RecB family endonuclease
MSYSLLKFDPVEHKYTDEHGELPSVTTILKAMGHIKTGFYAPGAAEFGTRVHEATELIDTLGLTPLEFPEELYQRLRAWESFLETSKAKVVEVEKKVMHSLYRYAGGVDRIATIDGIRYVLDIKSGGPAAWHQYQVAAYAMAVEDMTAEPIKAAGIVYLKDTGKFRFGPIIGETLDAAKNKWFHIVQKFKEVN